jgi:hypothetical protein
VAHLLQCNRLVRYPLESEWIEFYVSMDLARSRDLAVLVSYT